VEWNVKKGKVNLYEVAEDGSLLMLTDSLEVER
jgi:hypothetical protein